MPDDRQRNNVSDRDKAGTPGGTGGVRPGGPGGGPMGRMMMPVQKPKNTKGALLRIWKYMSKHSVKLLLILCIVAMTSVVSILSPRIIGNAIDKYIIPMNFDGLFNVCLLLLGMYIFSSVLTYVQSYFMMKITQQAVTEIRQELFAKLQTLPLKFFDSKTHGELMSRVTNDIDNISNALSQNVTNIFSNLLTLAGTLVMMVIISPVLTVVSVVFIPLTLLVTKTVAKHSRKQFSAQQKILGEMNGQIEEIVSGQKVVKVFTYEQQVIDKFEESNTRLKTAAIKAQLLSGMLGPINNAINNISYAVVVAVGGLLVINRMATVGGISSFITYVRQFTRPINELANMLNTIQSALAGAERVFEILDETPETADNADSVSLQNISGEVVLSDVTFSYIKDVPVLKDVNLYALPGQTIALVGPTGAGKTTIINLLTRFYDIDAGSISIDGVNIINVKRHSLRSLLGIVLQDTYLFTGTIRDNIRYGRLTATDEEIIEASKLANAHEFVRRLPYGYDTELTEGGSNLSHGQRQMLAIARAILADPAILILDEATSSVDTRTEVKIQEAMLNLMRGRTSFVIAHRLSTIRNADLIAVINHGEIIERGTHDRLLEKKGFYYNLYMSQFSGLQEGIS